MGGLSQHLKYECGKEPQFACPFNQCAYKSKRKGVPREQKKFVCNKCQRRYKYSSGLYSHIKYECGKEPQFTCPFLDCGYRAKLKGNLMIHINHVHKKEARHNRIKEFL